MDSIFWLLVGLILYAYCGYPLLLCLLSFFRLGTGRKADILPSVTVIIAAHNEEKVIGRKISATLQLDYPKDKLDVIIASDGSTDATVTEALKHGGRRVKVLAFPERRGKTAVQNAASRAASGEILVFTDATTEFEQSVIRALVRNFADPTVGAVGGELQYINRSATPAGDGGGFYWRYERFIKKLESKVCSLIGVSGCCYAVRARFYEDIPADLISDFVIAQMVYRKGARTVYEPAAVSHEDTCESFAEEFSMRVRVAVRSLHGLWRMRALLNPLRYGFFAFELLSHKVLRYLIPVFLVCCLAVNVLLLAEKSPGGLYVLMFGLQLLFYIAVFTGWCLKKKRFVSIPFYFFVTNLALMVAFFRFLRGERQVVWKPVRK